MPRKLTQEEFIQRARKAHGDKYDYSKAEYKGSKTKVCIICPIHGEFWQKAESHLEGQGCVICGNISASNKRHYTQQDFINKSIGIHGNKYDYSLVEYKTSKDKVIIICPYHGAFEQDAVSHLRGCGCPECRIEKTKGVFNGVAINDSTRQERDNTSYRIWYSMLRRCYGEESKENSYKNCEVCEEWKKYRNFKKWFDTNKQEYKKGFHLDKDILAKGNKVYSPETCCFVPPRINVLIVNKNKNNTLNVGVKKLKDKFAAYIRLYGKYQRIGVFDTEHEASIAYKKAREKYIQEVANDYFKKGEINEKVYNALMNYEIEITY